MSYSISTLLLRNLSDVFGENDPVRRRAAIDQMWHEDGVFYDPNKGFCHTNQSLARNRFRSETQFDPCISSVTTSIMITTSNSSAKRSGLPNQFLDVLLHTIACSELAHVRTEFYNLFVIPSLAPHPVQTNRESPRHGDLGNLPASAHHQV